MLRKQKEKILAELAEDFRNHDIVFVVDYLGLNVEQLTRLRRQLSKSGSKLKVAKNTLILRARGNVDSTDKKSLAGGTALIFVGDDPVTPARILKEFRKENPKPDVKAIWIGGELYGKERLDEFAALPGVNELRAKTVGLIKAPLQQLVNVLSAPLRNFVSQIDRLAKQSG